MPSMIDNPPMNTAVVFPARQTNSLGVIRSLGQKGIPVIGLDCQPQSVGFYSRYCRGLLCPDPLTDDQGFLEALVALGKELELPGVLFLMDDHLVLLATKYRAVLEKYYRFPFLDFAVAVNCLDKRQMYEIACSLGIPVPHTIWPAEGREGLAIPEGFAYPCILKPAGKFAIRDGSPEQVYAFFRLYGKAIRVFSREELLRRLAEVTKLGFQVVIQEEIPGAASGLYSLGAYCNKEGQALALFTGRKLRQLPPDFGTCTLAEACREPKLVEYGSRFLSAVGFWGIAEVEFKKDPRDGIFKFLEVNPRAWTWISLATSCGVDLPLAAYLDLLDRPVPPLPQREGAAKWTDLAKDVLCFLKYRRGGVGFPALSLREWLSALKGPKQDIYFAREDMLPGLMIPFQLLRSRFGKNRTSF